MVIILYKSCEVLTNTKIKYYADGSVKLSVANAPIYKSSDYVVSDNSTYHSPNVSRETDEDTYLERKYKSRKDSVRRSKNKVFDIVKMNDFDFFFTGTISNDCGIDRYNADEVCKKVNTFMYNLVKRGKIKYYIFVPEFHKDGAVHYHGFIKSSDSMRYSLAVNPRTRKALRRGKNRAFVFNWLDWSFGYTTLIHCYGSVDSMSKYFCKYITKSADFPMKHRYYAGGSLVREVPTDNVDLDFDSVPCDITVTEFGEFKYISFISVQHFSDFLLCFMTQFEYNSILKGGFSNAVYCKV